MCACVFVQSPSEAGSIPPMPLPQLETYDADSLSSIPALSSSPSMPLPRELHLALLAPLLLTQTLGAWGMKPGTQGYVKCGCGGGGV